MRLDTPTLFLVTVVVTFMVGVLFLMSWSQTRCTRALAIWGVAHLGGAAASALMSLRGIVPDSVSIGIAGALMLGAYGLIWSGIRAFEQRSPAYRAALGASALWMAACLVPAVYDSLPARIALSSAFAGLYCALGAYEIWRGRSEPLVSRYSALVLMGSYAAIYWARVPLVFLVPMPPSGRPLDSPWFSSLCFAGILFTIAIAFVFMALTKERAERAQRLDAQTDALTGIANRRAFVGRAQALLSDRSRPAALLLFDLDHFKAINDTYGHAVGDAVLVAFCHVAGMMLPGEATFGRMGGEEFAGVVPDLDAAGAAELANRVRDALARLAVAGFPALAIRVSVGVVATVPGRRSDFDEMLRRADAALYRAKSAGRDRVETVQPARERTA